MQAITISGGRFAGITFALLLASFGVSSCGSEQDDPADPPAPGAVAPGVDQNALTPGTCAAVARAGKVDICHVSDEDATLHTALAVPTGECSNTHALHPDDFLPDEETGCEPRLEKTCKPAGKTCKASRPTECCSAACICVTKKCRCG